MSDNGEQLKGEEKNNTWMWLVGGFIILAIIGTIFS